MKPIRFAVVATSLLLSSASSVALARTQDEAQKTPADTTSASTTPTNTADAGAGAPAPSAVDTSTGAAGTVDLDKSPEKATDRPTDKPIEAAAAKTDELSLRPYAQIAGGLKGDNFIDRRGEDRDDRFVTFAVARFGLLGKWGSLVTVQSELMASGGIGLQGTSAYEGQAALQVRQQLIRLNYAPVMVEVGRIVDEASVDFISAHVQDTLFQDTATRYPLLYSGYNLGNGVRATVEAIPKLRFGLAVNAGNPVATTATLAVGGTFPPFERLYTQAYQAVNQGPNHFPDDTFHSVIVTPSILYSDEMLDVKVAAQGFDINTNSTKAGDDHVRGYNLRGTARVKIAKGFVVPFASAAYTRNDTLEPNNLERRAADRYQAVNLGGGIDVNVARRFTANPDAADGVGIQYQNVQFQVGDGLVTNLRYGNLGGTVWLTPHVALNMRASIWVQQQAIRLPDLVKGTEDVGERNLILGLRAVIP